MNTMLGNKNSLLSKILKFSNEIKASGKNPQDLLNEAVNSGKYSNVQIENAKKMAEQFAKLIR